MNVQLALEALESAKASPEQFNMDTWVGGPCEVTREGPEFVPPCGTTACYAGWVAFQAAPVGAVVKGPYVILPDGRKLHVETYAIEALEITRSQAWIVFYLRDIEEVENTVKYLADNPGAEGDTLWEMFHKDWDVDL